MKKSFKVISVLFLAVSAICLKFGVNPNEPIIAIVLPMHHRALDEIVEGFKTELDKTTGRRVEVFNATGDVNTQKSIIERLSLNPDNIIIPIGTQVSQMALNSTIKQKVLCLAANPQSLKFSSSKLECCLSDEIPVSLSLKLMKAVFPDVKKITLVHSLSEKIEKEIPEVEQACNILEIKLQTLGVCSFLDLANISNAIDLDSQLIFILKDHLIVSGIQILAKTSDELKIPLMSSDEGSLQNGGAFALGVKEASIGREGARILNSSFKGQGSFEKKQYFLEGPVCVFANLESLKKHHIEIDHLQNVCLDFGFKLELINREIQP